MKEPTLEDWMFALLLKLKIYAEEPLGYCPDCRRLRFIGHADNCELISLIKDAEKFLNLDKE